MQPVVDLCDALQVCFAGKGVLDNLQSSDFTFNALLPINTSGEPTITLSLIADDGSLGGSYAGTVTKVRHSVIFDSASPTTLCIT